MASTIDPISGNLNAKGVSSQVNDQNRTQADREAQIKFNESQSRNQQLQRDQEVQREALETAFLRDHEAVDSRNQNMLASLKMKGYEEIREQIRKNQAELTRIKRDGERTSGELGEYYKNEIFRIRNSGEKTTDELNRHFEIQKNSAQAAGTNDLDFITKDYALRSQEMKDLKDAQFSNSSQDSGKQLEKFQLNKQAMLEKAAEIYQDQYNILIKNQNTDLALTNQDASQKLKDLRLSTSHQLKSYSERQQDPFYKLFQLNADLSETDSAFVLKAIVPEHEQKNISVMVRGGNQLVIAGRRKSDETSKVSPGRIQSSSGFQSFSESFPLSFPVDPQLLKKTFIGNELIITLPKKVFSLEEKIPSEASKQTVAYAKGEKPKFPENLPNQTQREQELSDLFVQGGFAKNDIKRAAGRPLGNS